jgi:hypothetical protein
VLRPLSCADLALCGHRTHESLKAREHLRPAHEIPTVREHLRLAREIPTVREHLRPTHEIPPLRERPRSPHVLHPLSCADLALCGHRTHESLKARERLGPAHEIPTVREHPRPFEIPMLCGHPPLHLPTRRQLQPSH